MNITPSSSGSLITAKWVDHKKNHRILLENTTSQLCSLKAFLPNACPRSQRSFYTPVVVQLEGDETKLLIDTKNLCRLLGIMPSDLEDQDPRELGLLLTREKNYLAALDQAAHALQAQPTMSGKERQTALKRTAQKVSGVASEEFENISLLPYAGSKEVQFWQQKPSRELGSGSFGAAHTVKPLGGEESSNLVLKLAHSVAFFKQTKTERSALKDVNSAEADLKNEFTLLRELHKEKTLEGIQLPPHEIVTLGEGEEKQVGYLGIRYDSDLSKDRDTYAIPDSALQLLRGLNSLSDKISHRDIKPENILVKKGSPSRVDIADFGGALTKETLKGIWNEGMQKIEELKKKKTEEEGFFQGFFWESSADKAILKAEQNLSSNLGQTYTSGFVPEEARGDEFAAIQAGDFESFFAIRQRADLFALGTSLEELFEGFEDRLSSQQLKVIKKMGDNANLPFYTIQEALHEWQLPATKNFVQTILSFFHG